MYAEVGVELHHEEWYEHAPKSAETSHESKVTKFWNPRVPTNRTIPKSKLDIIIHNDKKGTCVLVYIAISGDSYVIEEKAEKILQCKDLTTEIQGMRCKNRSDTNNNKGNWNCLKIIKKIPELHTKKARNQGTTETAMLGTAHIPWKVLL